MVYEGSSKYVDSTRAAESRTTLNDLIILTGLITSNEGDEANDRIFNVVKTLKAKYQDGTYTLANMAGTINSHDHAIVGIPTWLIIGDYIKNHRDDLDKSTNVYRVFKALMDMEYLNEEDFNKLMVCLVKGGKPSETFDLVLNAEGTHYDLRNNDSSAIVESTSNNGDLIYDVLPLKNALGLFANDMLAATPESDPARGMYKATSNHLNKAFIDKLFEEHTKLTNKYIEMFGDQGEELLYEGHNSTFINKVKDRLIELDYYQTIKPAVGAASYDGVFRASIEQFMLKNTSVHVQGLNLNHSPHTGRYIGKRTLINLFSYDINTVNGDYGNVESVAERLAIFFPRAATAIGREVLESINIIGLMSLVQAGVDFAVNVKDSLGSLFSGIVEYIKDIPNKFAKLFDASQEFTKAELYTFSDIFGTITGIGIMSVVVPLVTTKVIPKLAKFFDVIDLSDEALDAAKVGIKASEDMISRNIKEGSSGLDTVKTFTKSMDDMKASIKTFTDSIDSYHTGKFDELTDLALDSADAKVIAEKFIDKGSDSFTKEIDYVFENIITKGCLVGDTLVHTNLGYRPIRDIKVGDRVLSYDTLSGQVSYQEVYNVYKGVKKDIYWIKAGQELIKATEEHPFYVQGKGWVEASHLSENDILVDDNMLAYPIKSIVRVATDGTPIYNLSVEKHHTYFVTEQDILTHNITCTGESRLVERVFNKAFLDYDVLLVEVNKIKNFEIPIDELDEALAYLSKNLDDYALNQTYKNLLEAKNGRSLSMKVINSSDFNQASVNQLKQLLAEKKITIDDLKTFKTNIEANTSITKNSDAMSALDDMVKGSNLVDDLLKNIDVRAMNTDELSTLIKNNPEVADDLIKKISSEFGTSIKNNPLRQEYESAVSGLSDLANKLKTDGLTDEAIARQLHQARRDLGVKYKDLSPQLMKEYIYDVNIGRYGDELGPTIDYLINTKGKTWAEIIDSATRPNPDVDSLLGGFETWLRTQNGL